jgi:hypothetical protein
MHARPDPAARAGVKRWPLLLIAAPAAVSIWSGWVGLGGMSGFGEVQPFPGILPLYINTALTLPLGIESYAALALGAWLRPSTRGTARRFARASALGALALGMLGQVSYHLLAAGHDAEDGASTPMLMAKSGHTSVASLARYARPSAEALARWQASRDPARRR